VLVRVKLILPALLEANDPGFRPIKYALFPPLGLASLAGYLDPDDDVRLEDEHVMPLALDDRPDLLVMSVYITSSYRAYEIADHYRKRGTHVVLGGLHVSSMPDEAARHADTIFIGPGEDTWPAFLADFRRGESAPRYVSQRRSLLGAPPLSTHSDAQGQPDEVSRGQIAGVDGRRPADSRTTSAPSVSGSLGPPRPQSTTSTLPRLDPGRFQ
jgi:radical SAM superfamily enzyme YgiQ (UPF0313 family)